MANLGWTYFLWLTLGVFGIHHLYLRRPYHALTWLVTLGGVLGLGWLRDVWRIPEYVARANCDRKYREHQLELVAAGRRDVGWLRLGGMIILGTLGGVILGGVVPGYTDTEVNPVLLPVYKGLAVIFLMTGSAIGVYIVANIGEWHCSLDYPRLGVLCALPWIVVKDTSLVMPSLLATCVCWYKGFEHRPLPHPMHTPSRWKCAQIYVGGAVVWSLVLTIGFLGHATITTSRGEKVLVRDEISKFLQTVDWELIKDGIHGVRETFRLLFSWSSWEEAFKKGHGTFEERSSLRILGLTKNVQESQIGKRCRELSRQYHPDLQKTEAEKKEASVKFIQIQEACKVVKAWKKRNSGHREEGEGKEEKEEL